MNLDLSKSTCFLHYTKEDLKAILAKYGRTEESIIKDIEIIKEWLKTQAHLPAHPSDRQIASFLIKNKFYIRKVQEKIDMSYTIKTLIPDFYKDIYPTSTKVKEEVKQVQWIVLPKLAMGSKRIFIYRHVFDKEENINLYITFAVLIMNLELTMKYDISDSIVLIIDCNKSTFSGISKFTPMLMKKLLTVLEKVYSNRIHAIHMINVASHFEKPFNLIKSFIKNKLHDRMHLHTEFQEMLSETYGKETIPIEYGGTEKSCDKIHEEWFEFLKKHDDYFKVTYNQLVNENLRQEKLKDDDILGYYGSFRKVDVD